MATTNQEGLQKFTFGRPHTHAGKKYKADDEDEFSPRVIEKLIFRKADQPLPKNPEGK